MCYLGLWLHGEAGPAPLVAAVGLVHLRHLLSTCEVVVVPLLPGSKLYPIDISTRCMHTWYPRNIQWIWHVHAHHCFAPFDQPLDHPYGNRNPGQPNCKCLVGIRVPSGSLYYIHIEEKSLWNVTHWNSEATSIMWPSRKFSNFLQSSWTLNSFFSGFSHFRKDLLRYL